MLDGLLYLLGLGIALAAIIGIWVLYATYKIVGDDQSLGVSNIPKIDSMEQEGWELVYTDQHDDYAMLAQVYKLKSEEKYRALLSVTTYPQNVMVDEELDSYLEAKDWAQDWLNSYDEDAF